MQAETKNLFWNVDTQIDFMRESGSLYVQNGEEIEPVLSKLTTLAAKHNIRVVNSCDYHNEDSPELSNTPDFITTFPSHCIKNSKGQDFIEATKPEHPVIFEWNRDYSKEEITKMIEGRRNIIIRKDAFDVFAHNSNAENIAKVLSPEKTFVYGVAANVCVDFAVLGLTKRGYTVFVIEDAIKELPNIPEPFEKWKKYGVRFIHSEEILQHL